MKRMLSILLCAILCFTLFIGCEPAAPQASDVVIAAGALTPGMTFDAVDVYVTINGTPVPCTTEWTYYTEEGYGSMQGSDIIPENFWGRLDVTYELPKDVTYESCNFIAQTDGGVYDGTGDKGTNEAGQIIAWSHIQYDFRSSGCDVVITVDELVPGMTFDQIGATVTINGEQTPVKLNWVFFSANGYGELGGSEEIPEVFFGRLDVSYYLPKGVSLDDIEVTANAPGGTYDGTGSIDSDKDGQVAAWSHIQYDNTISADVVITVGAVQPGAQVGSIPVSVTVNGKETPCETSWIVYSDNGYGNLSTGDTFPKNYEGRLDVTYTLPLGVTWDDIEVTVNAPGGVYEGTGDASKADSIYFTAWSHIQYASEQSDSSYTPEVAPTTPPATEPPAPPATEHSHTWVQDSTKAATCGESGWTAYHCSGCSETYQEDTPALGHNFALTTFVSGSCPTGITWDRVCDRCGQSESFTSAPTDHTWGFGSYVSGRFHKLVCSICGDAIEASHTCNSDGLCSGCGEYIIN